MNKKTKFAKAKEKALEEIQDYLANEWEYLKQFEEVPVSHIERLCLGISEITKKAFNKSNGLTKKEKKVEAEAFAGVASMLGFMMITDVNQEIMKDLDEYIDDSGLRERADQIIKDNNERKKQIDDKTKTSGKAKICA